MACRLSNIQYDVDVMRSQTQNIHTHWCENIGAAACCCYYYFCWCCCCNCCCCCICWHFVVIVAVVILLYTLALSTSHSLFSCFIVVRFFSVASPVLLSVRLFRFVCTYWEPLFCKCLQFLSVEHTNRNSCLSLFRFQHSASESMFACFFVHRAFSSYISHRIAYFIRCYFFLSLRVFFLNISLLLLLFSLFFSSYFCGFYV